MNLESCFPAILETPTQLPEPWRLGQSRQGRPLPAHRFGQGNFRISLIGGCHADEPTGPRLLRKLAAYLAALEPENPLLTEFSWCLVPHVNPDGEAVNRRWYSEEDETYDLPAYLRYRVRELPGDDLEYGFPIEGKVGALRPENQFVYDCWREAGGPFDLHASLHGMGWSFGAWYLMERSWQERSDLIQKRCRERTAELGYPLFDIDRGGEKGFYRMGEGFCSRPDSEAMKRHFLDLGDPVTAAKFHPSSMESVRSFGSDCLTLVTEMPLFILPQKEKDLSWPNPAFEQWSQTMSKWTQQLESGEMTDEAVRQAAAATGVSAMPVADQMRLQWSFLSAGVDAVRENG